MADELSFEDDSKPVEKAEPAMCMHGSIVLPRAGHPWTAKQKSELRQTLREAYLRHAKYANK